MKEINGYTTNTTEAYVADAEQEMMRLRARIRELETAIKDFAGDIEPKRHHPDELLRLIEISGKHVPVDFLT